MDGKKDKKENSNFASFGTSSSQRSRVSRNVYCTMTIPWPLKKTMGHVMFCNMCHVVKQHGTCCYITCVMLCYITCVMLCNTTWVMLCHIPSNMLYNIKYVMTYVI